MPTGLEDNVLLSKLFSNTEGGNEGGGGKDKTKPAKSPMKDDADIKFGNWTGQSDSKVMAKDLMNRGLKGADQLLFEDQDVSSADAIRNKNQSDWKVAAIQNILSNAHKFNIHSPEAVDANRNVLIGNAKWVDAINNPYFNNIHENFWPVVKDILKDQWKKEENNDAVAKK